MSAYADVNYIKRMFAHPCATPDFTVLVETGLAAGTIAALELITAGCLDILKARAGKPWFHHRGFKAILSKQLTAVQKGHYFTAFTIPFGGVESLLNYFWLVGVGTSFAANWQSMIYVAQKCDLPGAGYTACGISSFYGTAGFEADMLLNCLTTGKCYTIGSNDIRIPLGCSATISYEAKWTPFQNDPANLGTVTSWFEDGSGRPIRASTSSPAKPGDPVYSCGGLNNVTGGIGQDRVVRIRFRVNSGFMGCSDGILHISGYGKPISLVPNGCKPRNLAQPYPTAPLPQTPNAPLSLDDHIAMWNAMKAGKGALRPPKPKRAAKPRPKQANPPRNPRPPKPKRPGKPPRAPRTR